MPLTGPQLATLKADILAKMAAGQPLESVASSSPGDPDANTFIAAYYNAIASPDYWVWRSSVTKGELVNSVGPEGTSFNWVGNGFITRQPGEQTAWQELFNGTNTVNASQTNVRQAFADIFSGSGNAAANRTHLLSIARRKAKRGERLFVVGPGNGTTGNPDNLGFEGNLTINDIEAARTLP